MTSFYQYKIYQYKNQYKIINKIFYGLPTPQVFKICLC